MERIMRSVLLVAWIAGLSSLGVAALTGSASRWLLHTRSVSTFRSVDLAKACEADMAVQVYQMWAECYPGRGQMAPVNTVLDEIWPKWQSASKEGDTLGRAPKVWAQQWIETFNIIEAWLGEFLVRDSEKGRGYGIRPETVPRSLREAINFEQVTTLPRTAIAWIEAQRAAEEDTKRALELADTGIIVIVIGAFGGLIFLLCTVVRVGSRDEIPVLGIEDFLFRPVLGAFLALAFLIADFVTHAVVSTGSVLEIRRESMYGLALAAGLLSEAAYKRLGEWLAGRFPAESTEEEEEKQP